MMRYVDHGAAGDKHASCAGANASEVADRSEITSKGKTYLTSAITKPNE